MIADLIALLAGGAYATGWVLLARHLFASWRPLRTPDCGNYPTCSGRKHDWRCYRQRHPDLTMVPIDTDREAAIKAGLTALLWPLAVLGFVIMARPPELEHEKQARLKKLDADIAERERQLGT